MATANLNKSQVNNIHEFKVRIDSEEVWNSFLQFPIDLPHVDYEQYYDLKLQQIIRVLNKVYQSTKLELKNYFTLEEAWLICAVFANYMYTPIVTEKEFMYYNLKDFFRFELHPSEFNVDENTLFEKILNLTEFQVLTVMRMAFEFKVSPERPKFSDSDEEDMAFIRKIFMIDPVPSNQNA